MAPTKITGLLLGVLSVVSLGCQSKPSFAPVEGTVTQAGKPLADVIVDFYPDPNSRGPRSTSTRTDAAGHYRLRSSWGGEDGAVVGPHRACITEAPKEKRDLFFGRLSQKAEVQKEELRLKEAASAAPQVPSSYGQPNETPLRVEVHSGAQVIDLEVK